MLTLTIFPPSIIAVSNQHFWLAIIKKWKEVLDKVTFGGIILTDLSKVFNFLKHDFPTAEFWASGCDSQLTDFILSYLSGRFHRTKINNAYKNYLEILSAVPQGSVVGSLLFKYM